MSTAAVTGEPIVRVRGLDKRFPQRRTWGQILRRPLHREWVPALRSVSLDVHAGEFFGLLGPNGAGKTTLFKILATLVLPDAGTAAVAGTDVAAAPQRVRDLLTPVVAGERSLYWRLSAVENLRLFAGLYGLSGAAGRRRAGEILEVVGLSEVGEKLVGTFSSGMKQRLLIGRALLGSPRVLLLDEPTRSLDPLLARDFRRFLREELVERQGCTVLLATHDAEEALELCTRVGVLHQGRLLAVGTVEALGAEVGDGRYRVVADAGAEAVLQRLSEGGLVSALEPGPVDSEGWVQLGVRIPGGRTEAAHVLGELGRANVEVAQFERVELALADLLERIMTRAPPEAAGAPAVADDGEGGDAA